MICELERGQFKIAGPLLAELAGVQPMCAAVLAGVHPGRVCVDDASRPRAAFLSTFLATESDPAWGFLAGEAGIASFNAELKTALFAHRLFPERAPALLLTCGSPEWERRVADLLAPFPPVVGLRRRYVCRRLDDDPRRSLPPGFSLQPLSWDLMRRPGLIVDEQVEQVLRKWRRAAGQGIQDFGFTAIDEAGARPVTACWATVDFVANGSGDIGFFTLPQYRRRGLALVTAAATMAHGLTHGLSWINWTCSAQNAGSIRIAQKLGLERAEDYRMYLLMFDEFRHWRLVGTEELEAGNYDNASAAYALVFSLAGERPAESLITAEIAIEAGRAWAATGETAKALEVVQQAVDLGWSDPDALLEFPEFIPLFDRPEWPALIQQCRANQAG